MKWRWWEAHVGDTHLSNVWSLEHLLQVVQSKLGLQHPATLYVYLNGEDSDVREKVVRDEQVKTSIARGCIFYVWEREKGSPTREAKDGLPLTVRTMRRETADVARRLSMGPPSTESSPNHNSPPRPAVPSSPPADLPRSPASPTAAAVFSASSPSSPSSGNSSPSSDGSRASGSQQADMRKIVLERDSCRCVFTDLALPPVNPSIMPVAHILPAKESRRYLHGEFVKWFQDNHSDKYAKYKDYIVPRPDKGNYTWLLLLPYPPYDSRSGLLAHLYFNGALEKGWVKIEIEADNTVKFTVPKDPSVGYVRKTLRSPLGHIEPPSPSLQFNSPSPQLSDARRERLYGWWPQRILFELYSDVWCPYCRWKEQMKP